MALTPRFNQAVHKLYEAFHRDTLHPECCQQCAVGNILDHRDFWKHLSDDHGSLQLNYLGQVHESLGRRFNGYKPSELLLIEKTFLEACGYQLPFHYKHRKPENPTDKNVLFDGLSAVIEVLCQLDKLPNVMDCSRLFQYEKTRKQIHA